MNKQQLNILIEQEIKQVFTKDDFVEVTTDRQKKNGTKAFIQRGYREPKYIITKHDGEFGKFMNLRRSDMTSNIQKYDYDTDYNIAIEDMVKYHNKSRKYNKRTKVKKNNH